MLSHVNYTIKHISLYTNLIAVMNFNYSQIKINTYADKSFSMNESFIKLL